MAKYPITASENEKKRIKIHAVKAATINAGAVISVFGIQLMGTVEKNGEDMRILVCQPTNDPEQKSVKLDSVCADAGIPQDAQKSIDEVIKYLGFTGGIKETKIDVHQAFYYYSSYENDKASDGVNQEYAFSLGITNTLDPKSMPPVPFKIESITFSLWNSTREKLAESMGIYTISDVLEKFSDSDEK